MRKGVIIVDSVWGVGHRKRMALLADQLAHRFEIDFFQTIPDVGIRAQHERVKHHFIPSLFSFFAIGTSNLLSPDEMIEREKARFKAYEELLQGEYAFLLYEQYPFGKTPLRYDMQILWSFLKRENPYIKRISSFRGYQWRNFPKKMRAFVEESMEREFDLMLFHIDERSREELLPKEVPFSKKCHFTGFIADERLAFPKDRPRQEIVVSIGGGEQGRELLQVAYQLSLKWKEYPFRFFTGPLLKEKVPFAEPFSEEGYRNAVKGASLLLSLGGYNSLMDHVVSKTPAVVLTGAVDQPLLVDFFVKRGTVSKIEHLDEESLESLIKRQLAFREYSYALDLSGAKRSLELIDVLTQ